MSGIHQMMLGGSVLAQIVVSVASSGGYWGYVAPVLGSTNPNPPVLLGHTFIRLASTTDQIVAPAPNLEVAMAGPTVRPQNLFNTLTVYGPGGVFVGSFASSAATFFSDATDTLWAWPIAATFTQGQSYTFVFT